MTAIELIEGFIQEQTGEETLSPEGRERIRETLVRELGAPDIGDVELPPEAERTIREQLQEIAPMLRMLGEERRLLDGKLGRN